MSNLENNITIDEAKQYLSMAKSIKGTHHFYDMHVHPFEIVFTKGSYQQNEENPGIYSTGSSAFMPPQISEIILEKQVDKAGTSGMLQRPAIFRMKFSALYAHTGPEVFRTQMNLSTVDRILLLPVAPLEGNVNPQMSDMKKIFAEDKRFYFGWSVSNDIEPEDVYNAACEAMEYYNICSIKQNLTQTGTNISHPEGKKRLESILDTCTKLNLPLILHSGKSPLAADSEASKYGELEVLEQFDWTSHSCPIVFAHSASYGHTASEIKDNIIPRLMKLLTLYDNILIDISGVDIIGMKYILESIPSDRILFGSDSLYEPQWQRVVKLLHTLEESSLNTEDSFFKIMSYNPEKHIFRNRKSNH